jgi:hypothetical protein
VAGAVVTKSIAQFLPLAGQSRAASDRHYRTVHTPYARRVLREMPQVLSYHTNRAEAERDLSGGWAQRPRAFRFVILRFLPGRTLGFPPEVRARIAEDHRNFLREYRGFSVDEQVLVDRVAGQTALVKYLIEYERAADASAAECSQRFEAMAVNLQGAAADAFGLRLVHMNRVLSETVAEPIDEPGQRPTERTHPETSKQGFVEIYFDHRDWAEEWFARADVQAVLFDPRWAMARAYRVSEECGLLRR